jgi:hypothetical protein
VLQLVLAVVVNQPYAPDCYEPSVDGWVGPQTVIGASLCCNCGPTPLLRWEVRTSAGTYASPARSGTTANRYVPGFATGLINGASYCLHARFEDDAGPGLWGPASGPSCVGGLEQCFTFDDVSPSVPVLLDAGVRVGTSQVELSFNPALDDGGGISAHTLVIDGATSWATATNGPSPLTQTLAPGTWRLQVIARDVAENVSGASAARTLSVTSSALVPAAPTPSWPTSTSRSGFIAVSWPVDAGDQWAITQQTEDAGWVVAITPFASTGNTTVQVTGPCAQQRVRVSRLRGTASSDWSAASAPLLIDDVSPVVLAPAVATVDGGVRLSWAAATDGCPSGLSYRLLRVIDGGTPTVRLATATSPTVDVLEGPGQFVWFVVAVDGAGNEGTSAGSSALTVLFDGGTPDPGAVDAGTPDAGILDAGTPDAGTPDAGAPDAGELDAGTGGTGTPDAGEFDAGPRDAGSPDGGAAPREPGNYGVGCACQTEGGLSLWLFALTLMLRTRSRRATGVVSALGAPR